MQQSKPENNYYGHKKGPVLTWAADSPKATFKNRQNGSLLPFETLDSDFSDSKHPMPQIKATCYFY